MIAVRPSNTISFRGVADQQTEKVIELVGTSVPFHIQKVESTLEDKVSYKLETVEEGKLYQLKISNSIKQGNYNGFIKIFTDVPQKSDIVLRINGSIEGDIAVKPQTILVGRLAAQQPPRQGKLVVQSNREKPFKILSLAYDQQLISVVQKPAPKEPGYILEITPNMDNIPTGKRHQTTLTIETDATPGVKHEVQIHLINSGEAAQAAEAIVDQPGEPSSSMPPANREQAAPSAPPAKPKKK